MPLARILGLDSNQPPYRRLRAVRTAVGSSRTHIFLDLRQHGSSSLIIRSTDIYPPTSFRTTLSPPIPPQPCPAPSIPGYPSPTNQNDTTLQHSRIPTPTANHSHNNRQPHHPCHLHRTQLWSYTWHSRRHRLRVRSRLSPSSLAHIYMFWFGRRSPGQLIDRGRRGRSPAFTVTLPQSTLTKVFSAEIIATVATEDGRCIQCVRK